MKFQKYIYKRDTSHFSQCLQMGTVLILHSAKLSLSLWTVQDKGLSHPQGFAEHAPSSGMRHLYVQSLWNVLTFHRKLTPSFPSLDLPF